MAQEPEIISQTVTQDTTTSVSYRRGWGWWGWNWGYAWNWGNYYRYNWNWGWNYNWWNYSNWGYWNWGSANTYNVFNTPGWGWTWGWWRPWWRVATTTTTTTTTTTDRILAKNEIPFIRSKDVNFSVTGLRPYTKFYAFFDGTHVSDYCKTTNFNGRGSTTVGSTTMSGMVFASGDISTGWSVSGPGIVEGTLVSAIGAPAVDGTISQLTLSKPATLSVINQSFTFTNGTKEFGTPLVSDGNGNLKGTFQIPNNSNLKFRVGGRLFKVSDVMNPAVEEESSWADALYVARGVIEDRQRTVFRDVRIRYDPLAQSFITDGKDFDGGVMVTGIGVYFATKDQTVPVTCELRTMVNGYPGEDLVHPLARTSLEAADIQTSTDATVETVFYFDRPIYLEQDQDYCFVLRSGSNKYNVYIAEMGKLKINSIQSVSKQPYIGSLFMSQNNSTWTADQWSDMKFNVYKAQFDITKKAQAVFRNVVPEYKYGSGPVFETVSGSTTIILRSPDHGLNASSKVALRVNAFEGTITSGSPTVSNVPNAVIDRINDAITKNGAAIPVGGVFASDTGIAGGTLINSGTTNVSGLGTLTLSANATASGVRNLSYGFVKIDNGNTASAIAAYQLSGIKDIDWADSRTITFTASTAASSTGVGWVDSIIIDPDYKLDQGFLSADVFEKSGTELQVHRKATTGTSVDGTQTAYQKETGWQPIQANSDMNFTVPMTIASQTNVDANPTLNGSSFDVKMILSSSNPNLSPVLDGQSVNLVTVSNLLANPDQTIDASGNSNRAYDHVIFSTTVTSGGGTTTITPGTINRKVGAAVYTSSISAIKIGAKVVWSGGSTTVTSVGSSTFTTAANAPANTTAIYILNPDTLETSPVGGITPSKYVIKPVKLETPATALRVMFSGNVVSGNYVDVYYKALTPSSATTLDNTGWTQMSLANNAVFKNANNKDEFVDYTYEVKGIPEFQTFQVKVVLRGTNSAIPPRLRDFRTIALAV